MSIIAVGSLLSNHMGNPSPYPQGLGIHPCSELPGKTNYSENSVLNNFLKILIFKKNILRKLEFFCKNNFYHYKQYHKQQTTG